MSSADQTPDIFNSNGFEEDFDNRSDDKGSEPEALTIGEIDGRTYAFIGLERTGGIIVYDVTDPHAPKFDSYQRHPFSDQGPEGLIFIAAGDSPTGQPMLVAANEVSATATLYEVALVERSPISAITHEDWPDTPSAVQDYLLRLQGLLQ